MKYPEILQFTDIADQLSEFSSIIDVRSPAEFAEDHLPGAINCPVLDDEERIRIGTLYKQVGSFEAKRAGAAVVAHNIGRHLEEQFGDKPREWRPLVYCWRGGNRSGSMAHILAKVGWQAAQLEGGYKAYRQHLNLSLPQLAENLPWRVLCGPTGSGKSRMLQSLQALGEQVLDLEQLAAHRGSVLGELPHQAQPSQKMFESQIWQLLRTIDRQRPIYVEAESKKVGNLRVPAAIMDGMRSAPCVSLALNNADRVALLLADYAHYVADPAQFCHQLDFLAHLHGKERIEQWKVRVSQGQLPEVVLSLLEDHYDPAYRKSIARNFLQFNQAPTLTQSGISTAAFTAQAHQLIAWEAQI